MYIKMKMNKKGMKTRKKRMNVLHQDNNNGTEWRKMNEQKKVAAIAEEKKKRNEQKMTNKKVRNSPHIQGSISKSEGSSIINIELVVSEVNGQQLRIAEFATNTIHYTIFLLFFPSYSVCNRQQFHFFFLIFFLFFFIFPFQLFRYFSYFYISFSHFLFWRLSLDLCDSGWQNTLLILS